MTDEETEKAFRQALADDPYDEVTHRAYADWLDERGRDAEARVHRDWTREGQERQDALDLVCEWGEGLPVPLDPLDALAELDAQGSIFLGDYDLSASVEVSQTVWDAYDLLSRDKAVNRPETGYFRCAC